MVGSASRAVACSPDKLRAVRRCLRVAGLILALGAPAAQAATLGVEGGTLRYQPGAGAESNLGFGLADGAIRVTVLGGDTDPVTLGPGCVAGPEPGTYDCSGVTSVDASGGDGRDTFSGFLTEPAPPLMLPLLLRGDDGNDNLPGGAGADRLFGGA